MILLLISFIAGVLTILAPCTLPVIPVIVGSSVGGGVNKRKAFTITISLGLSIILFTLILKVSTAFITIPPRTWSIVSGVIIIIFGLVSLFPNAWARIPFVNRLNIQSNKLMGAGYKKQSFWGDVIIGASLGPVFSTCSPTYFVILATVLPQSFFLGLIDLLAYAIGLSGMILLIAFLGQKIIDKLGVVSNPNGWFKKALGILFLLVGVGIMFGLDKTIQTKILDAGFFDVTKLEQKLLGLNDKDKGETVGKVAPELVTPDGYINTDDKPITIAEFKGKKVILLDVWTYTCINCQRTIPYIVAWSEKYKNQGLQVIGLHTPEFSTEKVKVNVEEAVRKFNIKYPVVMDNEYKTWNAYGNKYWPRKYLIDEQGNIIYDHIGEGDYEETEKQIQMALMKLNATNPKGVQVSTGFVDPKVPIVSGKVSSPETYFGSARNMNLKNGKAGLSGTQVFAEPGVASVIKNNLYLVGTWNFASESAVSKTPGKIIFKYDAKNVYMVANSDMAQTIHIYVDGVKVKDVEIQKNSLYPVVEGKEYGEHVLEIRIDNAGLNAFTFTFG